MMAVKKDVVLLHSLRKNGIMKVLSDSVYDLPVPKNISYYWNFGSLMGLCLVSQILTGLFLACHYTPHESMAFDSVWNICRNVQGGWVMRSFHVNGASGFFICIYCHMGRGLYYGSYSEKCVWNSGVTLYLVLMAIAFTGYVLPWGQMSFWGATVITSMFSVVPVVGKDLVGIIWGGEIIQDVTLKRFFIFHFLCPFALAALSAAHMGLLHGSGSSSPIGVSSQSDCVPFHPYFSWKDIFGVICFLGLLGGVVFLAPDIFSEAENFEPMDRLHTPSHIQPEWYFLYAYTILRAIQSKVGGISCMLAAIIVMYFLPLAKKKKVKGSCFNCYGSFMFWLFCCNMVIMTFIGTQAPGLPYNYISYGLIFFHMFFFFFYNSGALIWESVILPPFNDSKNTEQKSSLLGFTSFSEVKSLCSEMGFSFSEMVLMFFWLVVVPIFWLVLIYVQFFRF